MYFGSAISGPSTQKIIAYYYYQIKLLFFAQAAEVCALAQKGP